MQESEKLFEDLEFISKRFPFLFSRGFGSKDLDRGDDGVPYLCPFETQEGWNRLIYDTCEQIREVLIKQGLLYQYNIGQIKTKYGELRIYGYFDLDVNSDDIGHEIYDVIDAATAKSKTICEFCGRPGVCNNHKGLVATMCPECVENLEEITGR